MIYFFDNELNMVKVATSKNVISAVHEHELNGLILGTVEADLSYTEAFINDVDYFGYYYKDNYYLHKIKRVEHEHENELVRITGRHIFFEDMLYGDYIRDVRPMNRDALYILNQTISANTRWQTVMTDTSKLHSEAYYWVPPMEVLNDLTENVGIEYEPKILFDGQNINGFQLHVANRIGEDTPIRVPFGSRVLNLKYEVDYSEIVTALYGHGKGEEVGDGYGRRINFRDVDFSRNGVVSRQGSLFMENPSVTAQYGKDDGSPKFGRIIFEDIESASELANATYEAYLEQSRPKMLFEASVVDLGDVGMGDGVLIIRREYDVYFNARIHKLMVDLLDAENANVELGDYAHFKESKVQRKTRESNNQYRRETSSRIQQLKEQFNDRFDGEVNQMREDFEQALIDAHAEIQAAEERMEALITTTRTDWTDTFNAEVAEIYRKADEDYNRIETEITETIDSTRNEMETAFDSKVADAREYADDQIAEKERQYVEDWDARDLEIEQLIEKIVGGNVDSLDTNLLDINQRMLGKLDESDLEPFENRLTVNEEGVDGLLTRTEENEIAIGAFQATADGLSADFANYKESIDSDVGSLSSQVASYEASVDGFRAEVGTLQGDINNVDSWIADKGAVIDGNADAISARVWQMDIDDLKIGGRNLLIKSDADELDNVSSWRVWQSESTRHTSGGKIFAQARTTGSSPFGLQPGYFSGDRFEIVEGRDYIVSFEGYTSLTSGDFDYTYLMRADGGNQGSLSPYKVEDAPLPGASNNKRYYFKLTAWWSSTEAYLLIGARPRPQWADTDEAKWIRFRKPQIIEGTKEVPYSQAPEDFLQQTDFILESDGFFLGGKYVGGDHYSTAIVGSANGIDILADEMRLTGDLLVRGDVEAYALEAVEGEFGRLWADEFQAITIDVDDISGVTAEFNRLYTLNANIERLVAQHVFSDGVNTLVGNFVDVNAGNIVTSGLSANIIESEHIAVGTALIDKMFATSARIDRLISKTHFVDNIKTMSIDAVEANISNLRTKLLTSNVITSTHLNVNAALANKFNTNTAFIDRLEVKAANIRDLTGTHIRGGLLDSLNGATRLNLNTGDWTLGGSAKITFTNRNNRLEYSNRGITAGLQFDHSLGSDGRPMTAIGVSDGAFDVNDDTYRGLIVHSLGTEGLLGYGTSLITQSGGFYTRTDRTGSGINFRLHATGSGAPRGIYPQFTGTYDYNLGSALNPWAQAYIRDVRTSGELWIRDWNGTGGWHVGTIAESGRTTITLRGVSTNLWNYNLGSGTYRMNNIYLNNSPNVSSDERLKEDIKSTDLGLDFINGIEIKSFRKTVKEADINEGRLKNHLEFGVIAQQLRDNLISHGVDTEDIAMLSIDDDGYYGVQHEQLIAPTIKAVQEVNDKVESNAEKIARLEKEIEMLKGA